MSERYEVLVSSMKARSFVQSKSQPQEKREDCPRRESCAAHREIGRQRLGHHRMDVKCQTGETVRS